jgi:two-component system, OmpR family, sensor histidine kinase CiaH
MFTKLRNQFLIVNMVIISFIMLAAFASIYMITYQNVNKDIKMELNSMSKFYRKFDRSNSEQQQDKDSLLQQGFSLSFALRTDDKWNILATESVCNFDNEFYELAKNNIATSGSDSGRFTLDGNDWAYMVEKEESGYSIYSLDITAQLKIITDLIYTFIAVGFVMLIIIFFTSRFFANRHIAPIKKAFNKQKQFIADASHELKTPLTVIQTTTDVLLANSEDTIHNQSKWLHHIKSETERMKTLTNDLLYLTEMDHTQTRMIFAPFNVSEAVESIILTMEAVIFEKNIMLNYEIDPDLTVVGNAEQIKQVVMILLDNGIKYTNPNGSINVTLKKRHNDILLSVTNTGEGIQPEHLEKIFDRFYRTDSSRSRKHGGYGLGLAIAQSIVKQHKGKIYAKSTPNESTTFYVHLPG